MRFDDTRRRIAVALGVALSAHVLVLALLPRLEPRPAPGRIRLEFVPRRSAAAPPARAPEPPSVRAPPRPAPAPTRAEDVPSSRAETAPSSRAESAPASRAPPRDAERAPAPATVAPSAVEETSPPTETATGHEGDGAGNAGVAGSGAADAQEGTPDLFDPGALDRALDGTETGDLGGDGVDSAVEPGLRAGAALPGESAREQGVRVGRRMKGWGEDAQGEARASGGLYSPYFADLKHRIARAFQPTPAQLGEEPGVLGAAKAMAADYLANATKFGMTGNPMTGNAPEEHDAASKPLAGASPSTAGSIDDCVKAQAAMAGAATGQSWITLVMLTQAPDGKVLATQLRQPSGSKDLDRTAILACRGAAKTLGPPPAHGLGLGAKTLRTLWKFEVVRHTAPPGTACMITDARGAPIIAPMTGLLAGHTPLERWTETRVELAAVYGGETQPQP